MALRSEVVNYENTFSDADLPGRMGAISKTAFQLDKMEINLCLIGAVPSTQTRDCVAPQTPGFSTQADFPGT